MGNKKAQITENNNSNNNLVTRWEIKFVLYVDGSSSSSGNGTRTWFVERDSLRVSTNANRLKRKRSLLKEDEKINICTRL